MNSNILIIGIGNEWCGDDAFGIYAVKKLQKKYTDLAQFLMISGDLSQLLSLWEHKEKVIIVDAAHSLTNSAGHVYEFDSYHELLSHESVFYSSHSFGVAEVLRMAATIGREPRFLKLIGVEGSNWQKGQQISEAVKVAFSRVERIVLHYLQDVPTSTTRKTYQ